jgi:hypothetical protein
MAAVIVYFRDFGGEVVSTGIPIQAISTDPEKAAIVDQIQLWSIGENDGADELAEIEARIGNGANSPAAQSGVYAYLVFQDNVNGRNYKERLPMPDLAKAVDVGLNEAWTAEVDVSGNSVAVANPLHADYVTLKAALEAAYVSPAGNTAQLVKVYVPNKL